MASLCPVSLTVLNELTAEIAAAGLTGLRNITPFSLEKFVMNQSRQKYNE